MLDVELIRQTLSGNTEAFGGLVEKYRGFVYGLGFHLVGSFPDAEDLAQEALLRAYTNLHRLNDPRCFAAWLKRIVSNTCLDWGRRRGTTDIRLDQEAMELPADAPTPAETWAEAQRRVALQVLLARIPESSRLTLTLRYIDDLSYQEIARFLNVPLHTVKNRLRKGRAQLREEMIRMVENEFEKNRLGPEFDEKVMRELIGRGKTHIAKGECGKAIEELERARKINLTNARAFRLLMQATASQQDVEEASHKPQEALPPPEGVNLLDIRDISRRLEVSPVTIYRWIQQGLPCYRLPKVSLIRFDLNAVKRWLEEKGIRPEPKIPMLEASQTVKCILKGLADREIGLEEAYDMVLKFRYAE
ncbi:MAG: sigma-70 family RNA polymerase sigma factor [Candidatus Latescibacterota bacterium]